MVPGGKPGQTAETELHAAVQHHEKDWHYQSVRWADSSAALVAVVPRHEEVRHYLSVRWSDSSCEIEVAASMVESAAV